VTRPCPRPGPSSAASLARAVLAAIPLKAIYDVGLRRNDLIHQTGKLELQLFHGIRVVVVGRHSVQQVVNLPLQILELVYLVRADLRTSRAANNILDCVDGTACTAPRSVERIRPMGAMRLGTGFSKLLAPATCSAGASAEKSLRMSSKRAITWGGGPGGVGAARIGDPCSCVIVA
jgi:hypothetical protein